MTNIIRFVPNGDSIAFSHSPRLHRLAGTQSGQRVTSDQLVPDDYPLVQAIGAVYTPYGTRFLLEAADEGLQVISGYELFFGQGVDAWRIFTGLPLDEARMRRELAEGKDAP